MRVLIGLLLFVVLVCVVLGQYVPSGAVFPTGAPPATPGMVQWVSGSNTKSGNAFGTTANTCANYTQCFSLPNGAQAGNAIVFGVTFSDSPSSTPTCADDKGDTCTVQVTADDASNGVKMALARVLNATVGAQKLTITFGTSAVTKVAPWAAEFYNVATSSADDGHVVGTSASGSSTVSAGTSATGIFSGSGSSGDLIIQCGVRSQTPQTTGYTVGSQSNITWRAIGRDLLDGLFCQYGVYNSTSSLSPQFTMSSNSGYATAAIALKSASAGSARPAGMQIIGIQHEDITDTIANTSPVPVQASCDGTENLLVMSGGFGQTNYAPTGITDGASNTWTSAGTIVGNSNSGKSITYYAQNSTCTDAMSISVATTGTGDATKDATMLIYYVTGAATSSVLSQRAARLNTSITAPNVTIYDPIAPGCTAGIMIGNVQQAQNTFVGVSSPSGTVFDGFYYGGENISGGHPPDENNGWFHWTFASSAQNTWTITEGASTPDTGGTADGISYFCTPTATASALASDTFTRANINPLQTIAWGKPAAYNGFKISSNTAQPNSLSGDDGAVFTAITWPNDQWAQVTLNTLTGGSAGVDKGLGLMLRGATSAHTEYRILASNATGTNTWIEKFVAGSNTVITSGSASPAWTAGDVIYASVVGTTITVKKGGSGGTTIITGTDSSISSGSPGLDYSSTMTASSLINWSAGK